MGVSPGEVTVGLFIEERMLSDALTTWLTRKAPPDIRVTAGGAPAIAVADQHRLDSTVAPLPVGTRATVAILDSKNDAPRAAAALGYVAFTDPPEILIDAIQAVSSGTPFVSADAERLLAVAASSMPVPLTEKQRRLLALYVDGMTLRAAAAVIGITQGTAHGYLRLIRRKFRAAGIPATTKIELGLALQGRPDR